MNKDAYPAYQSSRNLEYVVAKYGDSIRDNKLDSAGVPKIKKVSYTKLLWLYQKIMDVFLRLIFVNYFETCIGILNIFHIPIPDLIKKIIC